MLSEFVSFGSCRRHLETMTSILWHVAVFDEAHKLKNDDSSTYKAAAALHCVTKRLYGLTGTVMQVPGLPVPVVCHALLTHTALACSLASEILAYERCIQSRHDMITSWMSVKFQV